MNALDPAKALGFDPGDVQSVSQGQGDTAILELAVACWSAASWNGGAEERHTSPTALLDSLAPAQATPGQIAAGTAAQQSSGNAQQVPDKSTWSGLANAVPSLALYAGVAGMANAPTALVEPGCARCERRLVVLIYRLQPPINTNPTNYQPQGTPERAMYAGAQAVGSLPSMAVGGEVAAPLLRAGGALAARAVPEAVAPYVSGARTTAGNAAQSFADMPKNPVGIVPRTAFVGGAAGQAASENVPEPYRDLVNVGANLAAGGGLAAAETALGAGGRAAVRTLGNAGIGAKQIFGVGDDAVRATQAQADAVAARLAQAAGPEGRAALINPGAG